MLYVILHTNSWNAIFTSQYKFFKFRTLFTNYSNVICSKNLDACQDVLVRSPMAVQIVQEVDSWFKLENFRPFKKNLKRLKSSWRTLNEYKNAFSYQNIKLHI